ncbi:MAG: hypothetical protein ACJ8AO_02420 [Gemmatimonadaceae bacterium]
MMSDTFVRMRLARAALLACLAAAAASCGDGSTPPAEVLPTEDLGFLVTLPDAPALESTTLSFWATKGQEEEVAIRYLPRLGSGDAEGEDFLRFRLEAESLRRRPDGSAIAVGDSVLITIAVVDPVHLIASFQPSGLQFDPDRPARLRFRFAETDDDRDEDGDVDAEDDAIRSELAIWRQEQLGQPWVRLSSRLEVGVDEVEARLTGFTNYAVAYRAR